MRLEEFDRAEGRPGHLYELGRGTVIVVDVPNPRHFAQVEALRDQLTAYKLANRERIYAIGGCAECKILLGDLESERHPDLAIYKSAPPGGPQVWANWIPEIIVEVVSPDDKHAATLRRFREYEK